MTPSKVLIASLLTALCGCSDTAPGSRSEAGPQTQSTRGDASSLDAKSTPGDAGSGADGGADADQQEAPLGPLSSLVRMEDARRLSRPVVEQLLKSPDVVLRRRTLVALGRVGNAESLGPLRTALTESDGATRRVALRSLGMLQTSAHEDAEKVLRTFLELEPRPPDQRAAIESLGRVGSPESVGTLMAALESPEPRLREAAARALGQMALRSKGPGEAAMVALASHITDRNRTVRLASAFALSRCKALTAGARSAIGAALSKALRRDDDVEVRIMAGRALGALDAGGAGFLIAAIENDVDWRVRAAAATALGRRGNNKQRARGLKIAWKRIVADPTRVTGSDLHPLMALLDEAAERPAGSLTKSIRAIEYGAGALLKKAADAPAKRALANVQCAAALAQDEVGGRDGRVRRCGRADPPLISEHERKRLRVRALHGSTVPGALKRLKVLLRDPDDAVRLAAVEATGSHITGLRLNLLERALLDQNPHVVASAAYKISTAGAHYNPKVIRPEEKLVIVEHTKGGPVTHQLREAEVKGRQPPTKAIKRALSKVDTERDVETAINLLRVIGALKATKAAEAARSYSGHHNQSVRREARKALEAMGLDPGPELQPDPPNLIDPAALDRLAAKVGDHLVTVATTRGEFTLKLRPDLAPATVANFLALTKAGFYDSVRFHRVVPGFVVQTGDPTGTGFGGPGHTIRCELSGARYGRGSVGMALAGADTGGSQFFITYSAQPHLDRRYTIFAEVTEGMEVVDSIQRWDRITKITPR